MNPTFRARQPRWVREIQRHLRETTVLLRQFRGALLGFAAAVSGGGAFYWLLARQAEEAQPATLPEAFFLALSMIFLQANTEFPAEWYLAAFFFVMPVINPSDDTVLQAGDEIAVFADSSILAKIARQNR